MEARIQLQQEVSPVPVSPIQGVVRQWEDRLRISLRENQSKFAHKGDRGDGNEVAFREFLRANLPPSYRIGHGEVVDYTGGRSSQVDVVIADEEQPFHVGHEPQLLIIEGVAAAAEVKTKLTTAELQDCISKGRKFKALNAVLGKTTLLAPPTVREQRNSDIIRYYVKRPYFIFAYSSSVRKETLLRTLAKSEAEGEVPPIDAVFILDKGAAVNLWDGNGAFGLFDGDTGESKGGWMWMDDPAFALTWLLFWLNTSMPRFAIRSSPLMAYLLPGTRWLPHPADGAGPPSQV
ncbi:DUF6602 domain-containing protein [Microbispora hainanensis]|uniref:DUF6602 domain-containing protein n=1 Tax=Microbispora hainanensis TaxID=568844 RepID=A0ABZ1SLH2_9ACTN|nr:DUF6602 domain-containing protein [Microbispora hainanensis]